MGINSTIFNLGNRQDNQYSTAYNNLHFPITLQISFLLADMTKRAKENNVGFATVSGQTQNFNRKNKN